MGLFTDTIDTDAMPPDVAGQSYILLDSTDWLVGMPRSPWAARWWGQSTEWCTAADLGSFWEYRDKGSLIVFLCRKAGTRWQFHPATGEFRDARNRSVSWRGFICRNPAVLEAVTGAFGRIGEAGGIVAGA